MAWRRCLQTNAGLLACLLALCWADSRPRLHAGLPECMVSMVAWSANPCATPLTIKERFISCPSGKHAWTFHVELRRPAPGELPGGSVVLGASASGATVYAEPGPAVALNNAEAALAGAEAAEEASILGRLTRGVAAQLPRLRQARHLGACARAHGAC